MAWLGLAWFGLVTKPSPRGGLARNPSLALVEERNLRRGRGRGKSYAPSEQGPGRVLNERAPGLEPLADSPQAELYPPGESAAFE